MRISDWSSDVCSSNFDGHRGSHRKAHNVYGMQMVRATYDGLKKLSQKKRPFTITRAAYAGTQRYASVWTGDNVATWEHLRLRSEERRGGQECGSTGRSRWARDH